MNTANAYLFIPDVQALITFTQAVFDATILKKITRHDGSAAHVEILIGNATLMAAEPSDGKYFPASLYIYVNDCDAAFGKALQQNAEVFLLPTIKEKDKEKYGAVKDSNGNVWWIVAAFI